MQVRLHGSRGGVFVGHRPPRDPGGPLQIIEVLHLFRWYTHTHTFTDRGFYTQTLTPRLLLKEASTHTHTRAFLVHTHTFTHIEAFRHRRVHRHFYTQTLLHTNAFTHRRFYIFASRLSQSGTYFLLSTWRSYSFFDVWFRLRLTLLEDLHRFREVLPGDLL